MQLNQTSLLAYLLGRSWLDGDAVISGDAVVRERRLRHTSFVVEQDGPGGLFVKQLHDPHPEALSSLVREVAFYRAVVAGRLPGLAPVVPRLVGWDEHERVLALTRFDGDSAQDRAVAGRPLTPDEATRTGDALARAHRVSAATAQSMAPEALGDPMPWAFHLARFLETGPRPIPGAGRDLLDVLRNHPLLVDWLAQLTAWWRPGTLIHGDLKWENVLLGRSGGDVRVCLIDWEMASVGDPVWDVATLLQAALLRTCLVRGTSSPLERHDMQRFHFVQRAFLGAWASAMGLADLGTERRRLLAFTAARLVYSAYEHAAVSPTIHPAIVAMVTTAWQMLGDERHAATLVGLDA